MVNSLDDLNNLNSISKGEGDIGKSISEGVSDNVGVLLTLNISEVKEKIEKSSLLNDFFEVNKAGEIIVKSAETSKGLKGHFTGLSIVPGVVLVKLFKELSGIDMKYNGYESIDFENMLITGNKVEIKSDGLYRDGEKIISIKLPKSNTLHEIGVPIDMFNNKNEIFCDNYGVNFYPTHSLKDEIDHYLLQSGKFRFARTCDLYLNEEGKISQGDVIKGTYSIPNDLIYTGKDGKIDECLYPEIVAQILSFGFSFIINNGIGINDKKSKLLTFANSTSKTFPITKEQIGNKLTVKCEVIEVSEKFVTGAYTLETRDGVIVQKGTVSGYITPKRGVQLIWNKLNKKTS
ncbi:MAG: hypothetical protein PHN31_00675 [Candidatus Gracilibacteria bacterium]|nr:hypothetical protein [Candidatus Gracilibacteria bacterium]